MDRDLLTTLKALSDASRLRIIGLLAVRPYAIEELAAALDLAPGTVGLWLVSDHYDESEYYRDYDEFMRDARALA